MAAMKKGPIGVWFSAALAILILGALVGYVVGAKSARYWDALQRRKQGSLHGADWKRAESTLVALGAIQETQLYTALGQFDKNFAKKYPLVEIGGLENVGRRKDAQEIRPVIDLYLGLAYVDAAMAEEQENNQESASQHMNSAQLLFQTLGWRDYSADGLKKVARHELDNWKPRPHAGQDGK
jgi:hypothetical protein